MRNGFLSDPKLPFTAGKLLQKVPLQHFGQFGYGAHEDALQISLAWAGGQVHRLAHHLGVAAGQGLGFVGVPELAQEAADFVRVPPGARDGLESRAGGHLALLMALKQAALKGATAPRPIGIDGAERALQAGAGLGKAVYGAALAEGHAEFAQALRVVAGLQADIAEDDAVAAECALRAQGGDR